MKRFVIVENGVVINTVLSEKPLAQNWIESDAGKGDILKDGKFTQPRPKPVEVKITAKHIIESLSEAESQKLLDMLVAQQVMTQAKADKMRKSK